MNISIIGSGSWGVALASVLETNNHHILFLAHHPEMVEEINTEHTLKMYAPTTVFKNTTRATESYDEVIKFSDILVIVVPSRAIEEVIGILKEKDIKDKILVIATKGLIHKQTISDYIKSQLNLKKKNISIDVLSGPSFAKFVLEKKITCVVSASDNVSVALRVLRLFNTNYFRVYLSNDVNGVEFCGGFKNVIALGAGFLDGYDQGSNARAALISRGLNEMTKYKDVFKIKKETLFGLAGVGDMVLTATDMTSRNYSLGYYIGKGYTLEKALIEVKTTAESVVTVKDLYEVSKDNDIDSPIIQSIYEIIYENKKPKDELHALMTRAIKSDVEE